MKYYVKSYNKRTNDEWNDYETNDLEKAKREARSLVDWYSQTPHDNYDIWIEDETGNTYDYNKED